MVAFIDAHREAYAVEAVCRVVPIPPTYYASAARRVNSGLRPARAKRDGEVRPDRTPR